MEKFALLNLLKAIDGLKNAQPSQNGSSPPPSFTASEPAPAAPNAPPVSPSPPVPSPPVPSPHYETDGYNPNGQKLPNIMYETLVRHEQISYRIKNKR